MATVNLPLGVYHRLRRLQAEAERDAARAEVIALRAAAEAARTEMSFRVALASAGEVYGFDPMVPYHWDDRASSLMLPPETPTGALP